MKGFLLFSLFTILTGSSAWPQSFPDLRFKRFTTKEGLSHNGIDGVIQDKHGYLWVVTSAGLNRFDGIRFVAYPHRPNDPLTPPSNQISDIYSSPEGIVWVASTKGIARFVYAKNHFVRVTTAVKDKNAQPVRLTAGVGCVWVIYTDGTMCRMNAATCKDQIYTRDATVGHPQALLADENRRSLWLATSRGFYEFDIKTRMYTLRWKSKFADGHREMIGPLCKDQEGRVWLASYGGELVCYHPDTRRVEVYTYTLPDGENGIFLPTDIKEIKSETSRYVAITTFKGLVLFDPVTKQFVRQQHQDDNLQSIPANYLTSACVDRTGLLWIGSARGLACSERVSSNFTTRYLLPSDTDEEITALVPSATGKTLWIGTSTGLRYYDTQRNLFSDSIALPAKQQVTALHEDTRRRLWIGTDHGLLVYDQPGRHFLPVTGLGDAFRSQSVTVITPDKHGQYWIGTKKGISLYDPQLRFVRNYADGDSSRMVGQYVYCLYPQTTGQMWVGTKQLLRYDAETQTFRKVGDRARGWPFPNCRTESKQGQLWFGTGDGVATYDPKTDTVVVYDEDNSDVASGVSSIGIDQQGQAWLWCADNLYLFDPVSKRSKVYRSTDGLVHQANGGQKLVAALDGGFYIQLRKGFQYFHPQRIRQDTTHAPLVLSHLMIQDQFFTADAGKLKDTVLELSHQQNLLCFQFSAADFHRSDEMRYIYWLEGIDKGWSSPIASQMITYTDLNAGAYTFRVRARNYDGYWQPDELRVQVHIRPPFWKTAWFLTLCGVFALGLVYMGYRSRLNKIRREAALRIKALDAEIKALRAQLNPHFTFNSLNAIQNLILDEQNDLASGYLAKMARLMRLILVNSEKSLIPLHDELELLRLYLEMEALRFDHSFTYEIRYEGQPAASSVMIPGMVFQPFVENAIWHGLMHRPGKKTVSVTFTVLPETRQIVGEVEDNGIGRTQSLQNSIFSTHKSRGMELTEQRLTYAERQTGIPSRFEVIDLVDTDGQPGGTRIKVTLPLILEKKGVPQSPKGEFLNPSL